MLPEMFVYEDLIAKKLNFNKKKDVELYLTILNNVAEEEKRFGSKISKEWRVFYSVGVSMRWQHTGSDFFLGSYKICKMNKTVGVICLHKFSKGIIINAAETSFPFSENFFKLYELGAKLLQHAGFSKIFCYIIKDHPVANKLPVKLVSEFVPPFDIVKLYRWT